MIDDIIEMIQAELESATEKFPPMVSGHEGFAVILEELDELWHEVKHGPRNRMREEAIQVAAMGARFFVDLSKSNIREALNAVQAETAWVGKPINSAHEGYMLMRHAADELWEAVKANQAERAGEVALLLSATAVHFLLVVQED